MINPWLTITLVTFSLFGCSDDYSTPTKESKHTNSGTVAESSPTAKTTTPSGIPTPQAKTKKHIIARVGKHLITEQDIDAAFAQMPAHFQRMKTNPAMRANILNNLLTRLALTDKAKQMGISDDPKIRGRIERAQSGILLQELNKQQRRKLATDNDQDLKAYYDANRPRFTSPEQVHVRHILLTNQKQADKVMRQLKKGADFAKLAKKYSQDNSSKDKGGDVGSFPHGRMAPAFEQAAFSLKKDGARTGPIKTRFGYHIIERISHTPANTKPFEQVKNQIKNELLQQKFRRWVETVKQEMGLTILDPRYQRGHPHPQRNMPLTTPPHH